ncbi:MAG: acyl carrier protein [Clostridia bacterium]|nr:acyl carrier protein [Clostridia bacterium]
MFEKLQSLLIDKFNYDKDQIKMETKLGAELGLNSIELAELVMSCEEEFNIEIPDDDIHDFETIGDVVAYLEKRVNG